MEGNAITMLTLSHLTTAHSYRHYKTHSRRRLLRRLYLPNLERDGDGTDRQKKTDRDLKERKQEGTLPATSFSVFLFFTLLSLSSFWVVILVPATCIFAHL